MMLKKRARAAVSVSPALKACRCSRCGSSRRVEAEDGARIVSKVALQEWLLGEREAPS
jgi:hypothetical protein